MRASPTQRVLDLPSARWRRRGAMARVRSGVRRRLIVTARPLNAETTAED